MTDTVDKNKRSQIMSQVRSQNTRPELIIRKMLYAQGIRYRLYRSDLPGKPDLCLGKYKAIIFIHGCLWHWHGCSRSRIPSTNTEYWKQKIVRNQNRDQKQIRQLISMGWRILIIWECAIKKKTIAQTSSLIHEWLLNREMLYNQIEPLNKKEVQLNELYLLSDNYF
ncbi:very short patch repair endonuclease [Klebsiella pneumoniae]|uniref:very short patch repair endonuclease n=1 Tax=Klebsiella pneumoniae TaxID=573 RepID=UPI000B950D53|nr:very short patch repair endonuclease [Klebsiella pneumoniae]MDG0022371.1 very short patch repair endonuclease [Klebsiella pneumoniae]TNK18080.1 DNA mismatch endonuclease Vsr [Klebsiella pneumoniae subsp. pneumoniae]HEN5186922.1 DNA mismatch endonuclease Vsr [Klebsiella pneumoniae]